MSHRSLRRAALLFGIGLALPTLLVGNLRSAFSQSRSGSWEPASAGNGRLEGPVRLALTALVIAPGKTSGRPWDGFGQLPEAVRQGLQRSGLGSGVVKTLFRALSLGNPPLSVLAELLPWTAGAFSNTIAAPDIEVTLYLNGERIGFAPKVANDFVPTWAANFTRPVRLGGHSQFEIKVIDKDEAFDDDVGICTVKGMPEVDEQDYATAQSLRCSGQVWAVALRVVPMGPQPGAQLADADSIAPTSRPVFMPEPEPRVPAAPDTLDRARYKFTRNVIHTVENAVLQWQTESHGLCPALLAELVEQRFLNKEPRDGWGQPLWYKCPSEHGQTIDLMSLGKDGNPGTGDDIKSWEDVQPGR